MPCARLPARDEFECPKMWSQPYVELAGRSRLRVLESNSHLSLAVAQGISPSPPLRSAAAETPASYFNRERANYWPFGYSECRGRSGRSLYRHPIAHGSLIQAHRAKFWIAIRMVEQIVLNPFLLFRTNEWFVLDHCGEARGRYDDLNWKNRSIFVVYIKRSEIIFCLCLEINSIWGFEIVKSRQGKLLILSRR